MGKSYSILSRIPYLLGGLGLVTLTVLAFRPAPIAVDLGQVERGNLIVTVDAEGKTRVRDRFIVAAPVEGRLDRIDLEEGDRVEVGAIVARIDPLPMDTRVREARAQLRALQAELIGVETLRPKPEAIAQGRSRIAGAEAEQREAAAQVERSRATLEQARRDRQRAEELEAEGAIARQNRERAELEEIERRRELDAARQKLEAAIAEVAAAREALSILQAERRDPDYLLEVYKAQIASIEAELANLVDEANRTEIRAPESGNVLRVLQKSARYVHEGDPLIEIGDPSQLEIVVDVLSADAVKIEPDALMFVERWGGDRSLPARVRYVEPSAFTEVSALGVEEQRVNAIADFVESSIRLGDGYRIEARIVVWEGRDVLKVPLSALFRCQQNWCTFVEEDGKAHRRELEIGARSDFEAVVNSGLEAGETVILHPTEQIEEGTRITAR